MAGAGERGKPVTITEALEDYSAHHPESVELLSKWPARRFRHFYVLHQRRELIASMRRQKDAMVAALWSNPNWDDTKDSKGHRKQVISEINEEYNEAIDAVDDALMQREVPEEKKLSEDNAFFAAAERGLEKVDQRVKQIHQASNGKPDDEPEKVDYMKDIDQG